MWLFRTALVACLLTAGIEVVRVGQAGITPVYAGRTVFYLFMVLMVICRVADMLHYARLAKLLAIYFLAPLTLVFSITMLCSEAGAWLRMLPGQPSVAFLLQGFVIARHEMREAKEAERRDQHTLGNGGLVQPRQAKGQIAAFLNYLFFAGCALVATWRCHFAGHAILLFVLMAAMSSAIMLGLMATCAIPRPPHRRRARQGAWRRSAVSAAA